MNAERLHAIVEVLKAEVKDTNFPELLDKLLESLRAAVEAPNKPGPQEQTSASREKLNTVLREAASNDFSPAWQQALEEMGIADLLGAPLADELERILSGNEITPTAAANEIEEIQQRVQRLTNSLNQASSALTFFQIGREDLAPGEFEIGFLIPRDAVDSGLEEFGKELGKLKQIIAPFSELAGEGRPEFRVRSISSSEFQVFVDSLPAVAALMATAAERLLAAYERILNIRNLHKQLAEQQVPDDALEGVAVHASQRMEDEIQEIVEQAIAEATVSDEGRINELKTEIKLQLNELAQRIDRGYNIEVRAGEIPESTGDETDESDFDPGTRAAQKAVLKAQPGLEFMNVSGKPILHLESAGEQAESDAK